MIPSLRPLLTNVTPKNNRICANGLFSAARPRRLFHSSQESSLWIEYFRGVFLLNRTSFNRLKENVNEKLSVMGFLFAQQCNFYASQRARRLSQMWNLYGKLYKDRNVKNLVRKFKNAFAGRNKPTGMLLGAVLFNWDNNKISDGDLQRCINDFKNIDQSNSDACAANISYTKESKVCADPVDDLSSWELLVQKSNFKIWRKSVPDTYLYEYKVYGSFYDIPSQAFFRIQMDLEYRKKWDKHIHELNIIDQDCESGCEVVHWIAQFPYPMYNREYLYIRRAKIDNENKLMVMSSKAIDHPQCPTDKNSVRVDKYRSQMVIRPHKSFSENGFDYVLTYFDDPQAVFPTVAYNWMASSGVSEFVDTLHEAAKNLQKEQSNIKSYHPPSPSNHIGCQSTQIPVYA